MWKFEEKTMERVLFFLLLVNAAYSVEIVNESNAFQIVRQGEPLELFCESKSIYQWCLFEHNDVEYTTTPKGNSKIDDGFYWVKSDKKCGIRIDNAEPKYAGKWKCHLAFTNTKNPTEETKIKDERWLDVEVATPATVQIIDIFTPTISLGNPVRTGCNVIQAGYPPVTVSLQLIDPHGKPEILLNTFGESMEVYHNAPLSETGSRFSCVWSQERKGEILYNGSEISQQMDIVFTPNLASNTKTSYIYFEEGVEIKFQFEAKPWPEEDDIIWYILAENETRYSIDEYPDIEYEMLPITQVEGKKYLLESGLVITNLTQNISLTLSISNTAGRTDHFFSVDIPPPTTTTTTTTTTTSTTSSTSTSSIVASTTTFLTSSATLLGLAKEDLAPGIIIAIVAGILFGIILLLLSLLMFRKKRRGKRTSSPEGQDNIMTAQWKDKEFASLLDVNGTSSILNPGINGPAVLSMSTFGKDGREINLDMVDSNRNRSVNPTDLEVMLPNSSSTSSASTDDISSLGVRSKDPDILGSWEDLEPGISKRRSRNIDSDSDIRGMERDRSQEQIIFCNQHFTQSTMVNTSHSSQHSTNITFQHIPQLGLSLQPGDYNTYDSRRPDYSYRHEERGDGLLMISGPTGMPVTLPAPLPSPIRSPSPNNFQRLHFHKPSEHSRPSSPPSQD